MRANKSDYRVGDLIPVRTSMGNTVHCKILDLGYPLSYSEQSVTMLLDEKALLVLVDEYTFRKKNKFDNVSLTTGDERTGKSMFTYAKKKLFESPYYRDKEKLKEILETDNWDISTFTKVCHTNLNQICFEVSEYREQLAKALEGCEDIFTLDESGVGLSALKWFSPEQVNLYIEFQVIGKKKITTDLVLPHKDDLNNRFRDRRVHFWNYVNTVRDNTKNLINRGFVEIREANTDKWKIEIYWKPFLVCKFPDLSDEQDWIDYEVKKDDFIATIAEQKNTEDDGSISKSGVLGNKYYVQSNKLMEELINPSVSRFKDKDGYTLAEIGSIIGTKPPALSTRLKKWNEIKEKKMEIELRKDKIRSEFENGDECGKEE
jgi:hypothetical protein